MKASPPIWPSPPTHHRVYYSQPRALGADKSGLQSWLWVWSGSKWPELMGNGMWRLMSFTQIWSAAGSNVRSAIPSANPLTNSRDVRDTMSVLSPVPLVFVEMWWGDTARHRPLIFIRPVLTVLCLFLAPGFFWCLNSSPGVFGWLALLGWMSSNKTEKRSKQIARGDSSHLNMIQCLYTQSMSPMNKTRVALFRF